MVSFFEDLSYVCGIVPLYAVSKKQLKWLIEMCLLIDVGSKKVMKVIFRE